MGAHGLAALDARQHDVGAGRDAGVADVVADAVLTGAKVLAERAAETAVQVGLLEQVAKGAGVIHGRILRSM